MPENPAFTKQAEVSDCNCVISRNFVHNQTNCKPAAMSDEAGAATNKLKEQAHSKVSGYAATVLHLAVASPPPESCSNSTCRET